MQSPEYFGETSEKVRTGFEYAKYLEFLAGLGTDGALAGVNVLVEDFPEVIGHAQKLEVLGILKSSSDFLAGLSKVLRGLHNLANQPFLALDVVVVEFIIDFLHHLDPLDNIQVGKVDAATGRPCLIILVIITLVIVVIISIC